MGLIKKTLEPALEFLKDLKTLKKGVVFCGHDLDTICSTVILLNFLKRRGKDVKYFISQFNYKLSKDCLEYFKKKRFEFVIIVDVPEIEKNYLEFFANHSKVLIIDHHPIKEYYKKVFYSNPRIFKEKIYMPATYICYKLYSKFFASKPIDLIAGLGTLADKGIECCLDLYKKMKKYGWIESLETIYCSRLFLAVKILGSWLIEGERKKVDECIKFLMRVKSLDEIFRAKKFLKKFEDVEREIKKSLEDFEKKKKKIGNFFVYKLKSKYRLQSMVATLLASRIKGNLIVYQKWKGYYKASFRRNESNLNLGLAAKEIAQRIGAEGGGHPEAASIARIKSEKEFLKEIRNYGRKNKKKN